MNAILRRPSVGVITAGVVLLALGGGVAKTVRHDFVNEIGYWGGVAGSTVAIAVAVLGVCLLIGIQPLKSAVLALVFSLGIHSYEELGNALKPTLGSLLADSLSGIVSVGMCFVVGMSLSKMLGIQWNRDPGNDARDDTA